MTEPTATISDLARLTTPRQRLKLAAAALTLFVAGVFGGNVPPPGAHWRWPCLFGSMSPEACGACADRFTLLTDAAIARIRQLAGERQRKQQAPPTPPAPPMAPVQTAAVASTAEVESSR